MSDAALQEVPPKTGKILSFPISKVDAEKREVWGYASTEALDLQGEIVDYEASVRAFDRWTSQFEKVSGGNSLGNVREMHTPKSVGKVIAYQPDPDQRGIWVGVKIGTSQDGNDAWGKVQNHELTGFSIGAPRAERVMEYHGGKKVSRVTDYDMAELSLVDNPACPESFFQSVKLASTFPDGGSAWSMEVLKRFEGDPKPSGEDFKPEVKGSIQKTVELNPDTFVDGSGEVWTRIGGRIAKREKPMSDPKELEKAGKKIGPDHKPPGVPPGPKADTDKDAPAEPMPEASGMGKDAPPHSNPALGGDGANDGRNSGNGEQESQIKGEKEGPAGMGKTMEHEEAAKSNDPDIDGKAAGSGFTHCARCGGPMKSIGDNMAPYHRSCAMEATKKAAKSTGGKEAAAGMSEAGLVKAVSSAVAAAINPLVDGINKNFKTLEKRLDTLKKSPAPGGPVRTELPPSVGAVEKGAGSSVDGDPVVKALEASLAHITDPMARDAVSRQIATAGIKKAFQGR